MTDMATDRRRILLEAGSLVVLHYDGPSQDFPLVVTVDQVADGLHWFLGSCEPVARGETVIVESSVIDEARYMTRATVRACSPATFALAIDPLWQRVQQREFVRILAHGLQVRVIRPSVHDAPSRVEGERLADTVEAAAAGLGRAHDLLDLSAGGLRFQSDLDYEQDEEVVCHFELPGSLCFVLPARVVRPPGEATGRRKPSVAVEFVGLDENNRSQLLRWVYREQVRRHRQEQRRKTRRRGAP